MANKPTVQQALNFQAANMTQYSLLGMLGTKHILILKAALRAKQDRPDGADASKVLVELLGEIHRVSHMTREECIAAKPENVFDDAEVQRILSDAVDRISARILEM